MIKSIETVYLRIIGQKFLLSALIMEQIIGYLINQNVILKLIM